MLVVLIGLARLTAHLLGWNVERLDGLVLLSSSAGSMSPATALAFVLLGAGLSSAHWARLRRAYEVFTTLTLLIGWLGVVRYVFGGMPLIPLSAMAIHPALMFLTLSAGVLSLRRDAGLVGRSAACASVRSALNPPFGTARGEIRNPHPLPPIAWRPAFQL
jgi:FtsH-binding integral membrane protein